MTADTSEYPVRLANPITSLERSHQKDHKSNDLSPICWAQKSPAATRFPSQMSQVLSKSIQIIKYVEVSYYKSKASPTFLGIIFHENMTYLFQHSILNGAESVCVFFHRNVLYSNSNIGRRSASAAVFSVFINDRIMKRDDSAQRSDGKTLTRIEKVIASAFFFLVRVCPINFTTIVNISSHLFYINSAALCDFIVVIN